jgi:hypothetical protein
MKFLPINSTLSASKMLETKKLSLTGSRIIRCSSFKLDFSVLLAIVPKATKN